MKYTARFISKSKVTMAEARGGTHEIAKQKALQQLPAGITFSLKATVGRVKIYQIN